MTTPRALASLWIGGPLGFLEVLCLKSMVAFGHSITLYSYGPVGNVPDGVIHKDAQEVFPCDFILVHRRTMTPSAHSDIFRLKLMQQTQVIWVDLDFLLTRPLDLTHEFIFAPELEDRPDYIGNSVFCLPATSQALAECLKVGQKALDQVGDAPYETQISTASFGTDLPAVGLAMGISDLGPVLVSRHLKATGEDQHRLPRRSFYPIGINDLRCLIEQPKAEIDALLGDGVYGVHMWATRFKHFLAPNRMKNLSRKMTGTWLIDQCERYDVVIGDLPSLKPDERVGDA
jgi:hypothetical protein